MSRSSPGVRPGSGWRRRWLCVKAGLKVCIADVGAERLAGAERVLSAAAPQGAAQVMAAETDVSSLAALSALAEAVAARWGVPDILMNNAGIQPGSGMFGPRPDWERVMAVNLWGVINGVQAFVPGMIKQGQAGPRHQHGVEAGHHHAAGRPGLQCVQGGREGGDGGAGA